LKVVINTLLSTVEKAYEAVFSKINEDKMPQAWKLLHNVVAAIRPLDLKDMNDALAIEHHNKSYSDLDLDHEARFQASVRHLCGLFVKVVDDRST
jgi:hypothetical protein